MNWDRIEGNWKEFKGEVKAQWGKLTDDDLNLIGGHHEQLEGRLQKHYGNWPNRQ
jgi:uncharacterized protein YjbJ (UPF0337 family)